MTEIEYEAVKSFIRWVASAERAIEHASDGQEALLAAYLADTGQTVRPERGKQVYTFAWIDEEGRNHQTSIPPMPPQWVHEFAGAVYQELQKQFAPKP